MKDFLGIDTAIKSGDESQPNSGTGVMVKLFELKALRARVKKLEDDHTESMFCWQRDVDDKHEFKGERDALNKRVGELKKAAQEASGLILSDCYKSEEEARNVLEKAISLPDIIADGVGFCCTGQDLCKCCGACNKHCDEK